MNDKIKNIIRQVIKEEAGKLGITFRSLLDGEIAMALRKVDLSNYYERNKLIDEIEKRLMQSDWISMSNGTTFEKTFVPTKKVVQEIIDYTDDIESNIFLNKVKNENPEMFIRFLNLVKNKGLDIAKDRYKEFDKELQKQISDENEIDAQNKILITSFVKALPKALPQLIDRNMEDNDRGKDISFYVLIGNFIDKYGERYGFDKADKIETLINHSKYEDYFFEEIDKKYGDHVIEW